MYKQNQLMKFIQYFFQNYLTSERGLRPHTIKSYRDTIKLFVKYLSDLKGKKISSVDLDDLTADKVRDFLNSIELKRENSVRTRNQRLAVLKTFFSYLLTQDVTRANQYEKVSHIDM